MSVATIQSLSSASVNITADDLLVEPYEKGYELEDGQLEEIGASTESSWIAGEIYRLIANVVRAERSGWAFPEGTSYQCFPGHPNRVRRPDASFIRQGRIPEERLPSGHLTTAPDLAVEVLSPNDLVFRVERKVQQYMEAGVRLVWIVNPDTHIIRVHRPDGSANEYAANDQITGEDVLPALQFAVADVFPPQISSSPVAPAQ